VTSGRADTPVKKREILERLLAEWEKAPQQRLGQLLVNATRDIDVADYRSRMYYLEDEALAERVEGKHQRSTK